MVKNHPTSVNQMAFEQVIAQSVKGRILPSPENYVELDINVTLTSPIFSAWVDEFVAQANLETSQNRPDITFTVEEVTSYLHTILVSRIRYVRNERGVIVSPDDDVRVPAFFSVALAKIGRAENSSLGLILLPKINASEFTMMSANEIRNFSRKLSILEKVGFTFGSSYAREKSGDFHTMSFLCTDDFVRSHTDTSPEAASVLAAYVAVSGIQAVLSPRVVYGAYSFYANIVRSFVR